MKMPSSQRLLELTALISDVKVLVAGDLILDRYIWGDVDRISPEAPVPVVDVLQTEDRLGGAGNVVRNLSALGAGVDVCGYVGDDDEGRILLNLVAESGCSTEGIIVDRARPTTLKTRVIAHRQQVVRIDRERRGNMSKALNDGFAAVVESHLSACQAVVVSDYGKGAIGESLLQRLQAARAAGRAGLKIRPIFVDPHPSNYASYNGISLAKPNRREAEIASGVEIKTVDQAFLAARKLIEKWNAELMVVTLGEDGLVVVEPGKNGAAVHLETAAQEVFDVSGAGDTVTAVFAASLAAGGTPIESGVLANLAAGVVVREVGTVAITKEALLAAVNNFQGD
jgi:rfaE bifunctional protein kinase chain/domain